MQVCVYIALYINAVSLDCANLRLISSSYVDAIRSNLEEVQGPNLRVSCYLHDTANKLFLAACMSSVMHNSNGTYESSVITKHIPMKGSTVRVRRCT
jgi:hypothetical protein